MVARAIQGFIKAFSQYHIASGLMSLKLYDLTSGCYKSLHGPCYHVIICNYTQVINALLKQSKITTTVVVIFKWNWYTLTLT